MRIHTDRLTRVTFYSAAHIARVDMDLTEHGSQSRERAFNVILRGESNRRPNYGTSRSVDRFNAEDHAATWDQWGVFLAHLFATDSLVDFNPSRSMFTPYDADATAFADRTADRFGAPEDIMEAHGYVRRFSSYGWPEDAHGDHSWRNWTPGPNPRRECRKCTAVEVRA